MGLHYILQHLDKPGTYARILFVDFSFSTIMPERLSDKLTQFSVPSSIGQSGLLRGLSVLLCPASKIFTPPERRKGLPPRPYPT